jgi:DNA (cytosine-5)-methyltransferase 1
VTILAQTKTPVCRLRAQADPNIIYSFYEFFAGGGMARVGLGSANWSCAFANDFDHQKGQSYRDNFGGDDLKVADVASLTLADLPGTPDLVWASPPCQDISLAGKGAGLDGSRSGAFFPWWRLMLGLIAERRAPRVIVIENVAALVSSKGGADFTAIARALAEAGYVFGALVINAALLVPQSRERVFIVAVRAENSLPPGLTQDGPTSPFHTASLQKTVSSFPPSLRASWRWWKLPTPAARNTTLLDLLDFDAPCDADAETRHLLELMEPLHIAKVESARVIGARAAGAICRRMRGKEQRAEIRFDGLAQALRTPGGGSSIQRFLLIDENGAMRSRKPTPRECARLMGLPDTYILPASVTDSYQLTGDGVVASVVAYLNEHLLSRLCATDDVAEDMPKRFAGSR